MSLVSRYFGRRPDCRRWRNSWSGYAIRLWPQWLALLLWLPGLGKSDWIDGPTVIAVLVGLVGAVWVGIDHIAMCGEYIWFRGWWVPRRFHVSEIVNVGQGGGGSSPLTIYVMFRDRHRKDNSKTIRMDLSRYMWIDRRQRLMDDIAAWLTEHGSDVTADLPVGE